MFEKEAKKRARDYTDNEKRQVAYECGFLDGVDLGYNKAIVEIKDAYEGNGNFSAWFENYLEDKNV